MTVANAMAFAAAALLASPASAQTSLFDPNPTYKAESAQQMKPSKLIILPVYRLGIEAIPPQIEIPPRNPHLPPKEFDKPYIGMGALVIMRQTPDEIAKLCPNAERRPNTILLGCARGSRDNCTIYIADDETLKKYNEDYEIVYRHERGHCNGWRHDLNWEGLQ
jgi:hypothetical protein